MPEEIAAYRDCAGIVLRGYNSRTFADRIRRRPDSASGRKEPD